MALTCQLGDLTFRVNPSQIAYDYKLDTTVIPTIGGRVVQVYGATLGDLTVQGLFGEDRANRQGSGAMAEAFARRITQMVMQQSKVPTKAQLTGADGTPMHQPFRFVCSGDGVHEWDFQVYVKSLTDVKDQSVTISHKVGKFSYGYNLVLFIVEDNTGKLTKIATDAFIDRLSKGIGWQRTQYNGSMNREELNAYLQANSPDGTIHGLILKQFEEVSQGNLPGLGTLPANPVPGGVATAGGVQSPPPSPDGRQTGPLGNSPNPNPVQDPNSPSVVLPRGNSPSTISTGDGRRVTLPGNG